MPNTNIMVLLTNQPRSLIMGDDGFRLDCGGKKMGINPWTVKLLIAVHALRTMTKSMWEKKVEVYKK